MIIHKHPSLNRGRWVIHELPIIRDVLKVVLQRAELSEAERVISISLGVGELRDLQEDWVQRYFTYVSRDTIAAGATLKINRLPVMVKCRECGGEFRIVPREVVSSACPHCASGQTEIVSGRELFIEEIEVI